MTTCPRCAAANEADRAACWNCFAPLVGPTAVRVKPMLLSAAPAAVPTVEESMGVPAPPPAKKRGMFGRK